MFPQHFYSHNIVCHSVHIDTAYTLNIILGYLHNVYNGSPFYSTFIVNLSGKTVNIYCIDNDTICTQSYNDSVHTIQ